jgi:hypothetical protein
MSKKKAVSNQQSAIRENTLTANRCQLTAYFSLVTFL